MKGLLDRTVETCIETHRIDPLPAGLFAIASAISELAEAVRERPGDVHYHHTHLPMETPKEPGWVPSGYPPNTAGN